MLDSLAGARWLACLLFIPSVVLCAQSSEPTPERSVATPVQAIWKAQEIEFYYQSFTTFYSCTTLETKIKRLLVALGAAPNTRVRSSACLSRNEIARVPRVEIQIVSPVEATPEELAERDKTKSTRELVARVRGATKEAAEAEAQFPAEWKRVSLSRGQLNLEPGDCELIEQLKKKVLPKLAVRVVEDRIQCVPNQIRYNQPQLVVDVLTELPKPDSRQDK